MKRQNKYDIYAPVSLAIWPLVIFGLVGLIDEESYTRVATKLALQEEIEVSLVGNFVIILFNTKRRELKKIEKKEKKRKKIFKKKKE